MYHWITELCTRIGFTGYIGFIAYAANIIFIVAVCIALRFVVSILLGKITTGILKNTKFIWKEILADKKLFYRISNLVIPVTATLLTADMPDTIRLLTKLIDISSLVIVLLLIDSLVNTIGEIYRLYEVSKTKPLQGFFQIMKVVAYISGGVIGIAILIDESPVVLLGGFGAVAAVISFVFKDAILGFVAGVQLTANDMVRIGDWIELSGGAANGTVLDISMTTVKVQNFDHTIASVPAYTLVSEAFINWRGMEETGGRRIKRAVYIDVNGVVFCDGHMIDRFKSMAILKDPIQEKISEIAEYNECHGLADSVSRRRFTNLGIFRIYITEYLKRHPGIDIGMALMVRQLDPADKGLPLEIYAFTNTVEWSEYEKIQSDIFDHLYAVIPEFGLRIFQNPSGGDIYAMVRSEKED